MPTYYPKNRQEIAERQQADIRAEFGTIDFLAANFFQALVIASSGRHFECYEQIEAAQKTAFPHTATGIWLDYWGALKSIVRQPASQANGEINVTGTIGTIIPNDTILTSGSGKEYKTTENGTVNEIVLSPDSLTRSGSIATITFLVPHNIATGISGTIAGADQSEYNGNFQLVAKSDLELTYEITGTPATPATGTITLTVELASVGIRSIDFGADVNLPSGSQLTLQTPISGIDDIALAEYGGIQGGSNQESDDSDRTRILLAYAYPIANFNNSQIKQTILLVPEVTRAWVFDATPIRGNFTAYFVLDERDNIYPTGDDIARVITELNKIRPAPVAESDMIILSPTPQLIDFTFISLSPLTTSMQEAIEENLKAFFFEKSNVGESISEEAYNAAIYDTVDTTTGQKVQSFVLTAPTGDIIVPAGSLAALGNINWNIP